LYKFFINSLLLISILLISGCDFKKVQEGNKDPKEAMKCGAGKCGSSMLEDDSPLRKNETNKKSGAKCGAQKIDTH